MDILTQTISAKFTAHGDIMALLSPWDFIGPHESDCAKRGFDRFSPFGMNTLVSGYRRGCGTINLFFLSSAGDFSNGLPAWPAF